VRASFQTGVNNKKNRHAPIENNGITGSRLFYIQSFSPFFLKISRSLIRNFILGFSFVRASFQTGVNNKKKLDLHRSRITALREAKFFISENVIK